MPRRYAVVLSAVAALAAVSATPSIAWAAENCTSWMDQGNGTSWKECVDDNGRQHCYEISNAPGSTAYEVTCS